MRAIRGEAFVTDFIAAVKKAFSESLPSARVFAYEEIDSTNSEAKRRAASENTVTDSFFVAKKQSAGRGRRGRSFLSREGGLYLSYLFKPTLPTEKSIMLTVFSAVAVCETVEEMTGAVPVIKWVNDVFLGGKKLAGILTEGEFSEKGRGFAYAVLGIGVNLSKTDFGEELSSIATDLESECGVYVDVAEFAARLAAKLSRFESENSSEYMKKYRDRCFIIGERVRVASANGEYSAKVLGVRDDGSLEVLSESGEIKKLFSAEVSVSRD